ncbi:hypothetical protein DVH26_31545 [Paenibacillus sp. H1-7]|uniref:hypothetical protein n=1 Tax=Paenibacillus sp. H1-7 TaxID=2282849 RepID=UPI001EF7A969|nr:hypothetical protein [Paenibacillus sp. H1-7]ULL18609.1 hypothetical protein DVH26_31545 [Paenibacillus sp. H1-7]
MNKKWVVVGTGLTLGSALFVTSAFAGIGDAAGYDAYKAAIKQTASISNVTKNVHVSVQDNGTKLLDVTSTIKSDSSFKNVSADVAVKAGDASNTAAFYKQDSKGVVKPGDSDVYGVIDMSGHDWHHGKDGGNDGNETWDDSTFAKERENVIDALVGGLKDQVTLTPQADGTKQIDLQLNGSQIPAVANAISSLVIKGAVNGHHPGKAGDMQQNPFADELKQFTGSLPKLSQDIQIKQVSLHAAVDAQNRITGQTLKVTVTGKDDKGAAHEVVIDAAADLSGFDATTPEQVDLTGKQVQNIEKTFGPHKGR